MSQRIIKTTDINTAVGMRFKSGHINWLQQGITETFDDLLLNLYPDLATTTVANILWGGVNSGSGANYIISAGAAVVPAFFSFAKLRIPATTFTAATGAVCVLVTTFPQVSSSGDPTAFSDGSTHDTLQLTELHVVDGDNTTPGYVCDYSAVVFLKDSDWVTPTLLNGWTGSFQYRIVGGKYIETKGIANGASATNQIFFQFPVGLRPSLVVGTAVLNTTDTLVAFVDIGTNGNIAVVLGYTSGKSYTAVNLRWDI